MVLEFYRINIGFFFIAIGFFFGFLSGREHKALAEAFVSSPLLLLIPFSVWTIYALKIINFNSLSFSKNENAFLYSAASLPRISLWNCLLSVTISQLSPIILYGCFLIIVAIKTSQFIVLTQIVGFQFLLTLLIAWRLRSDVIHPNKGKTVSVFKNKLDTWMTKPFVWFYPEWILRKQPLLILGTKLFAGLLIIGVSRLYLFDEYDARLMGMGVTLAFTTNIVVVYYYQRFENFHFNLLRSLPFSISQRMIQFLVVIALLSLLEWGVLFSYFPKALSIIDLTTLYAYGLSIYFLSYAFLFVKDMSLEQFINKAFIAAFVWIILILFKLPVLFLTVLHFGIGILIYRNHFYRFEFTEETGSEK
ncbi:MAG TPA: hypothetical protein VIT44_15325 [Cyclobacteriaceae bacterium]